MVFFNLGTPFGRRNRPGSPLRSWTFADRTLDLRTLAYKSMLWCCARSWVYSYNVNVHCILRVRVLLKHYDNRPFSCSPRSSFGPLATCIEPLLQEMASDNTDLFPGHASLRSVLFFDVIKHLPSLCTQKMFFLPSPQPTTRTLAHIKNTRPNA